MRMTLCTVLSPRPNFKTPSRLFAVLILAVSLTICLFLFPVLNEEYLTRIRTPIWNKGPINVTDISDTPSSGLAFISRVYVISLPRRTDRRAQMEILANALGLRWTYVSAVDADTPDVSIIMRQVHVLRTQLASVTRLSVGSDSSFQNPPQDTVKPLDISATDHGTPYDMPTFDWPHNLETPLHSQGPLAPLGADLWLLPSSASLSELSVPSEIVDRSSSSMGFPVPLRTASRPLALACASGDAFLAPYSEELPPYKHLTPAKIACWHSHLQVIRKIANGGDPAALVLEDDIDIERDVRARLGALWDALPQDWDIVYLGHCWSNETLHPALTVVSPPTPTSNVRIGPSLVTLDVSSLHPSVSPKCTHAYALSRAGARRLLVHLRHPPFAYSRAIDQAMAWLVQSRQLRAFSVVPPVVVQRKIVGSDVMPGRGSTWREVLYDGVLGSALDSEGPGEEEGVTNTA